MKSYKDFDGYSVGTSGIGTPKDTQVWLRIERWSKKWLKPLLAAGIVILLWALWSAFSPPKYTHAEMQDYAIYYLNENK